MPTWEAVLLATRLLLFYERVREYIYTPTKSALQALLSLHFRYLQAITTRSALVAAVYGNEASLVEFKARDSERETWS